MNDSQKKTRSIYFDDVIIGDKSSRLSSAVMALLCILPIFAMVLFGAVDKVTWVFITIFWAAIVLLWLAEAWKGKGLLLNPGVIQIPLIGLLLIGFIQLLPLGSGVSSDLLNVPASHALSLDPYATRFFILHLVVYIVFFAACLTFINKESRLKKAFLMVIIFGAVMAFFGILQRLANPDGYKLGGGSRVKKIAVNDMWSKEGTSNSYVQKFSYTTVKDGKTISSGVASYEPALGGEENAMKQPLPYDEKVKLAPDNSYYTETPIGESFFPSASIGYSEVKVESTDKLEKSVGTGSTVSKFYTAKDFPTITDFTNIVDGTVKVKPSVIAKIFKFNVVDQRAVSQGFSVETNDMHGKPKEEIIYNQNGAAISTTNYYYKTDDPNATTFHLNNKVQVVNTEGVIEPRNMGVETDIWQEMQEENSRTETMGIAYNNEVFTIFGFVFYVPIPLPIYQNQNKGIKMAITTKHIRRMGILDKIVKTVDGSTQSTQNLAYDIETGDVLLTQTQNEYNDPLYNFTYPAHWAYDGMGSAYKNVGNVFKGVTFDNGVVMNMTPNDVKKYFTAGDELILTDQTGLTKEGVFYVAQYPQDPLDNSTGTLRVFYPSGEPVLVGATYTVRIKRSGRRNKSAMPIGSIASLKNPFVNNQLAIISGNGTNGTKVIQSDAKEYHDIWGMRCPKVTTTTCDDDITTFLPYQTINPYVSGTRGNWRSWRGFLHYNDRNVTSSTASSNIRRDGYIPEFAPYWAYNSSSKFWESSANNKWVRSDLIVHYDQRGNEIESKDANDIVSSASFGFNGTQVVAVTANAQHQEMTYDSFEDYDFKNDCKTNTTSGSAMNKNIAFYRGKTRTLLDGTVSHTGKYSMAIEGNAQVRVSGQLDGVFCGVTPNTLTLPAVDIAAAPSIPGTARITAKCEDCLPEFELLRDKRYTMTAWVASQTSLKTNEAPLSIKVSISTQDGSIPVNLRPQGPVIEGWQKLEGQFTTSGSGQVMYFTFTNISTSLKCYVDDVRILPFNAKMKAYAYDQRSRRLMAELDENHYATFYEYDDEGQLVRIKRETETGIQTVKEARNYLKPN